MKTALLFFVLFGVLANLFTCGSARPVAIETPAIPAAVIAPAVVTPAKPGETETEAQLRQARDVVANLSGDLASWKQRVTTLTAARDQDRRDAFLGTLRASCLWVAGIALLGAFACGVLAFASPIAKGTLGKVAMGCGALVVLATGAAWAVPWLPAVGVVALIVIACGALAAAVMAAVRWIPAVAHAGVHAAAGYQEAVKLAQAVDLEAVDEVDRVNVQEQKTAGRLVHSTGDALHRVAAEVRARVGAL